MKALAPSLFVSLALFVGCAAPRSPEVAKPERAVVAKKARPAALTSDVAAPETTPVVAAGAVSTDPRSVGESVTFAFSGAYRKAPLRLTQRVVAKGDGALTIDYVFAEKGSETETWRVTTRESDGSILRVEQVAKDGSAELLDAEAFEAKLGATVAIADENEALLDETEGTLTVGATALPVTRATYAVRIKGKKAKLETVTSKGFAWGDVGGTITGSDGKIFFKAELVDLSSPSARTASLD
jgi:hypothetical protein